MSVGVRPPRTIELRGVGVAPPPRQARGPVRRRGLAGWLGWGRRLCALYGVLALLAMGVVDGMGLTRQRERLDALSLMALTALVVAVLAAAVEVLVRGRAARPVAEVEETRTPAPSRRAWLLAALALVAGAAAVVQSWYHGVGPLLGGGDIAPPAGTAWSDATWNAFGWSGWDVGSPGTYQNLLPWAAVLRLVTGLGGGFPLAQQLFYTLLLAGSALSALFLLRVLGLRPVGALVGAAVYALNPYTVSQVGINPVFLCGSILLALTLALVLSAGFGRLHPLLAAGLLALTAPLWGYAYLNPPLVGMVLIAVLGSPLVALWMRGRRAALRTALTLLLALPLLALASSYWLVVSAQRLSLVDSGTLSSDAGWLWTEGRSTLPNSFWLNTSWGWAHAEYFPYASVFEQFPLALLKYGLPALAFSALALRERRGRPRGSLTVVVLAAAVALFVVLLATGTNDPGSAIFLPLYHLPYGWLLREPGRFLMVGGLGYGVLIGTLVDRAAWRRGARPERRRWWRHLAAGSARARRAVVLGLAAAVIAGPAYPLVAGAVVADDRPGLPPSHVRVPAYWPEMAATIDALPDPGAVLVLPVDDFYQMPYTWGYYGTDSFIEQLIRHHVLTPSGPVYSKVSTTLMNGVRDAESALVDSDWIEARRVMLAMDAPYALVRDDVDANYPLRSITPPPSLDAALMRDPDATLLATRGALHLYRLGAATPAELAPLHGVATIDSDSPDLAVLSLLPDGTHVAGHAPLAGSPAVSQLPPLAQWTLHGDQLEARTAVPPGRGLSVAVLGGPSGRAAEVDAAHAAEVMPGLSLAPDAATGQVDAQLQLGPDRIGDGDFAQGTWGAVGDCYAVVGAGAAGLSASVVDGGPGGGRALRLTAQGDSACTQQDAGAGGSPLLVSFDVRHVTGAPPRVCLWEFAAKRCADMPSVPMTSAWTHYQAVVQTAAGSALSLHFYADGPYTGPRTIDDYANVSVHPITAARTVDVLATESAPSPPSSMVFEHMEGYGRWWTAPTGYVHTAVDGLFDGWAAPAGSAAPPIRYAYGTAVHASYLVSAGVAVLLVVLFSLFAWRRHRARARRHDWGLR